MNISRRGFLGKSLKALAVAVVAPVIVPLIKTPTLTANPVPITEPSVDVVEITKSDVVLDCRDYSPQITIQDYVPGQKLVYEDLWADPYSCAKCMYFDHCTATGGKYEKIDSKRFIPEIWSRKLAAKFYDNCRLSTL